MLLKVLPAFSCYSITKPSLHFFLKKFTTVAPTPQYQNLLGFSTELDLSIYLDVDIYTCTPHHFNLISVSLEELLLVFIQLPNHVPMQTPWTEALQASPSLIISWSLPKFMFIALVIPSNYLILWCPSLLLPLICPSIRDFSNEPSVHIR